MEVELSLVSPLVLMVSRLIHFHFLNCPRPRRHRHFHYHHRYSLRHYSCGDDDGCLGFHLIYNQTLQIVL